MVGRLSVRAGKRSEPGGLEKQRLGKYLCSEKHAGKLDKTRQTGNRQTENTGINTLEEGWRQSQRGEPDQGVTVFGPKTNPTVF
jgi:hypothetical protein